MIGHHFSLGEGDHATPERIHHLTIVRDEDDRGSETIDLFKEVNNFSRVDGVEISCWFVGDDDLGAQREGPLRVPRRRQSASVTGGRSAPIGSGGATKDATLIFILF